MARLVVYVRSAFCPDVWRWQRWLSTHPVERLEIDIDQDDEAYARVRAWTGHESVPTLVIAPDDDLEPLEEPEPLPGRSPRAIDRGSMLTEPNPRPGRSLPRPLGHPLRGGGRRRRGGRRRAAVVEEGPRGRLVRGHLDGAEHVEVVLLRSRQDASA